MTQDVVYRSLAQKVRQTARAQLMEIRAARQARLVEGPDAIDPAGDLAGDLAARRRRRADRMLRQSQDARLQSAIAAGRIEMWDASAAPSMPPDSPVLVDDRPAAIYAALMSHETGTSQIREMREHFGPVWDHVAAAARDAAQDGGGEMVRVAIADAEFFGPFLPDSASDALTAGDATMTLAAEMRVPAGAKQADGPATALQGGSAALDWTALQSALTVEMDSQRPAVADLASLPGAGPSLVWMLQKCGISSMEDLANSDVATLVPRLGLVGQIVNVQGWLQYAQRQVSLAH